MSITVVIPTHNRYNKLRRLLDSIEKFGSDEIASIIVVDDSDVKQTLELRESLHVEHVKNDGRTFISKAKNIGWRNSKTEFVFFIDDDNVVGETTIQRASQAISKAASIAAVMPSVLYDSRRNLVWVYATPFLNKRFDLNLVGRNLPRDSSLENRFLRTDALPNASLVRRKALEQVAGFDERLVVNSSLDFCQRLKSKGWLVFSDTGTFIFHDVQPPGRLGWWAAHGSADPDRVKFELQDWFLIMKHLHAGEFLLVPRLVLRSLRFVMPNLLAYIVIGKSKTRHVRRLIEGYAGGIAIPS